MIIDHRTYTFRPGTVPKWLNKYEADGLPIQKKFLGEFLGLFTTEVGNLHQVVFMWAYDSMADRELRRAAMEKDPDWQKFIGEIWDLDALVSQEIKFLKPVSYSPIC
jgi:hypothetical protein